MKPLKTVFLISLVVGFVSNATAFGFQKEKQQKKKRDVYSAVLVGTRGAVAARSVGMTFRINEYTSDEKVMELANLLAEGGTDPLRRALEKIGVGRIAPTGNVGSDIAVARVHPMPDGRNRILLVTARNIPFLESYHSGRTLDYPFSWIELYVDESGKGTGRVIAAAKLKFNEEALLEVESYGLEPLILSNVRKQ